MKFYRVDTGYTLPHHTTARHIVEHEENELSNCNILYSTISRTWLENIPAWRCMWFTKTLYDAQRYGDDVDVYDLYDFVIIAEDGEGGYLIVMND